ncbi:CIC11C00000002494 [Sungouiella intermedia]|uniref:CIC11C00000002494 n=1 Tax=Sungouiella intermedia TaxID=45354 RepID=A0A1L0DI84_9ASCO|nr:CIC11C00000002494 [[Candida] intermedia]
MLPFAIPYPAEQEHGYWGIPTSTIDWCEENYVVSSYIAEALNTVTNSCFIALASFAIYHGYTNKLDLRFILSALGFLLVGIGLWLFHMTLKYEYQLLDELPMIYATCIPFWSVFSQSKSTKGSVIVGLSIFFAANLLTAIYLHFKNPTIHQAAYALLNAGIIFQSARLAHNNIHDKAALKQLNRTMIFGVSIFLLGYFLWNVDIHFCPQARATRREWGIPYGFILEGHGWWHILTGTGVYFYLVYEEYLHCWLTGTNKFYSFEWKYGLPVVVLKDEAGLQAFKLAARSKKDR